MEIKQLVYKEISLSPDMESEFDSIFDECFNKYYEMYLEIMHLGLETGDAHGGKIGIRPSTGKYVILDIGFLAGTA